MKGFVYFLITAMLTFSSYAQCNDDDISGCTMDVKKCLDLADNMPMLDQQNLIRYQCLLNYKKAISKEDCLVIAEQMNSDEAVDRAKAFCK